MRHALACALLLGACSSPTVPPAGDGGTFAFCPDDGAAGWAVLAELNADINRPDDAHRNVSTLDGGVLVVSGAHGGGRLFLTFTGAPVSGALVQHGDAGCDPAQGLFFYLPSDGGSGGGEWGTANLTVSDGGIDADGGQRTVLSLTSVNSSWVAGPLPDRSFDLVLP